MADNKKRKKVSVPIGEHKKTKKERIVQTVITIILLIIAIALSSWIFEYTKALMVACDIICFVIAIFSIKNALKAETTIEYKYIYEDQLTKEDLNAIALYKNKNSSNKPQQYKSTENAVFQKDIELKELNLGARDYFDIPKKINDCNLTYDYRGIKTINVNWDVVEKCYNNKSFIVNILDDGTIKSNYGVVAQLFTDKSKKILDMVNDFNKKEFPVYADIGNAFKNKNILTLRVGFYRNNIEYFKNKNSCVVSLTGYQSDETQSEIDTLITGQVLSLEEDGYTNNGDTRYAVYASDKIGRLPKKAVSIMENEGIDFIIIESINENDSGLFIPKVRIFY